MCEFEIAESGEHQITIKLVAIGESHLSNHYMIEWAGSPSEMWSNVGERRLRIDINNSPYDYFITDKLFRFELKK